MNQTPPHAALPPAIFLMGPTASGKTAVAVELAQRLPVEIISVDSALIYRDMNIGTAKPDAATLARAPHHLIDLIAPTESYSAAHFSLDARRLMDGIHSRGKIPLLVGGTMLYFRALRFGLSELPQADPDVRAEIEQQAKQFGWPEMHRELAQVDAETAARLAPNDAQRINRALEIFRISGQPMSRLLARQNDYVFPYRILPVALFPSSRNELHQRIEQRFRQMVEQGLVEELRNLREKYALHPDLPAMRCVGYRQAWELIEGRVSESEFIEQGLAATRQLAKRQLTWLRGMPDNLEFDCLQPALTEQIWTATSNFLTKR